MNELPYNRALWPDDEVIKEEAKKVLDHYRWRVKTGRMNRAEAILAINDTSEPLRSAMQKQMKVTK